MVTHYAKLGSKARSCIKTHPPMGGIVKLFTMLPNYVAMTFHE